MGMTREELEKNLGTIAKSGSLDFKSEMDKKDEIDIIGQFGVGFYSAFMVSDKVSVLSRAYGSGCKRIMWESSGADGYTITEAEKDSNGTEITLTLKEDTDDERLQRVSRYLQDKEPDHEVLRLHQISYTDDGREAQTETGLTKTRSLKSRNTRHISELETLNSMVPLWKKNKSEIKDEDYNEFYKDKFYDFTDPAKVIHTDVEGVVSYTALLFIPGTGSVQLLH